MKEFQDYAYYYNIFYQDKNYRAEAETVRKLIGNQGIKPFKMLNLGCGTGSHDLEFTKLGYQMTGIDMSQQMIDIARANSNAYGCNIDFEVADIRDYAPSEKFDVVVSLFHVISYQNRNDDVIDAFKTAAKALDKGGLFIFDLWYGPGVLSDKPSVRVKTVEDSDNILYRIARPVMHIEENVVDVNYEILVVEKNTGNTAKIEETHKMRYFFVPELEFYLEKAGFELIECIDCDTLGKTDFNSWTAYCVARYIGE